MGHSTNLRQRVPAECEAREYGFVILGSLVALALTSIPYVVGASLSGDGRVFGGFVYAVGDCYSYLAKMRQGAEGAWLFHIPYTPEAHPGALFFLFHLLLGKIAALLPGDDLTQRLVWIYHAARWIFGVGLLTTIYHFLAVLTGRVRIRRVAWSMIAFGGGLGWLLVALGRPGWLGSMPLDLLLPEAFTFLVLFAFPHIALARTLLLWGLLALVRSWDLLGVDSSAMRSRESAAPPPAGGNAGRVQWRAAGLAGLLWLGMGLVVPFYIAVAWAVVGAAWVFLSIRQGRPCWTRAAEPLVAGLISAPVVLYSAWRFSSHPVYATWAAQNQVLSPHPLHYLAAFGVPLALALTALPTAWRSRRPAWLAIAWVAVVPLLVYLPFNLQRRLVEAVQIPLSLLAAIGLTRIADSGPSRSGWKSRVALCAVLFTMLPTNALLIGGTVVTLRGQPSPVFRDRDEIGAMDWLAPRVRPTDVVLASFETGNYLPARVGARAFLGHGPESVRETEKRAEVNEFFEATTSDAWRRDLLKRYGVDYVLWGPAERALGGFQPVEAPYLRERHQEGHYIVFEVAL